MSECSEDTCLVKNGSNMYLGDDKAKELVIICDHVHFLKKNEWTQECFLSPKGAETHVTLTGNKHSVAYLGSRSAKVPTLRLGLKSLL